MTQASKFRERCAISTCAVIATTGLTPSHHPCIHTHACIHTYIHIVGLESNLPPALVRRQFDSGNGGGTYNCFGGDPTTCTTNNTKAWIASLAYNPVTERIRVYAYTLPLLSTHTQIHSIPTQNHVHNQMCTHAIAPPSSLLFDTTTTCTHKPILPPNTHTRPRIHSHMHTSAHAPPYARTLPTHAPLLQDTDT